MVSLSNKFVTNSSTIVFDIKLDPNKKDNILSELETWIHSFFTLDDYQKATELDLIEFYGFDAQYLQAKLRSVIEELRTSPSYAVEVYDTDLDEIIVYEVLVNLLKQIDSDAISVHIHS